jgi:hypothetical protein
MPSLNVVVLEVVKDGKTLYLKEEISVLNIRDIFTPDVLQAKRIDPSDTQQIASCLTHFYLASEKIRPPSAILVDKRPKLVTIRITTEVVKSVEV